MGSVCLIGQVFLDTLRIRGKLRVRLGGIFHAARGLWAAEVQYQLCYLGPQYLDGLVENEAADLEVRAVHKFGNITHCPNVLLVDDEREVGAQHYEMLLEPEKRSELSADALTESLDYIPDDVLIFPGAFDLGSLLERLKSASARVHIDTTEGHIEPSTLARLGRPVETLITSTSTHLFLEQVGGSSTCLREQFSGVARNILLKENRGGSRLFTNDGDEISVPAHTRKILHSVGVGDCFDAIYVSTVTTHSPLAALGYSSLIAAEYACRFDDGDSFKAATKAALGIDPAEVSTLMGVSLPWEVRAKIEIYIAAPDFSTLYRPNIEAICSALAYHNFTVHRPVQDNGEVPNSASPEEKSRIGHLDADLIRRCRVLLAVLEYDDPGTYVEIGMAATLNIPVVVYDPHSLAQNLMVTSFATLVSADRDVVLGEIYRIAESLR